MSLRRNGSARQPVAMLAAAVPLIIAASSAIALLFFIAFFRAGAGLAGVSAFTGLIKVSIIVIIAGTRVCGSKSG